MERFQLFWDVMSQCDWTQEGDDELVLKPVISFLSHQEDEAIFQFSDQMSELLYRLDTCKMAEQCRKESGFLSDDGFLYSRCVALINGPDYYQKALRGGCPEMWNMEFEALLYAASTAWGIKHDREPSEFPHVTAYNFETGSNR